MNASETHLSDTAYAGNNKIESTYLSAIVILHIFIILLAIIGNSLVIYLVVFNFKLRNVRNAFMINLTFSNLLLATVCTPWFLITLIYPRLSLSNLWCKLSNSLPIVIILVSAFSIMMISIDRWMFVVYSRSRQFKRKEATIIIILIWVFAILLAAPMFYNRHSKNQIADSVRKEIFEAIVRSQFRDDSSPIVNILGSQYNSSRSFIYEIPFDLNLTLPNYEPPPSLSFSLPEFENNMYCVENWADPYHKRVYILILFCLEFVLPCLCMFITYIWIIRFLKIQNDRMSHYEMLRKKLIQKERPHQKNCKLLSALCITFIVCCLPLSLFNIVTDFIKTSERQTVIYGPLTILTTLELLNTVLSPLLYGWMNHNFRIEINEKLNKLKKKYRKVNRFEHHDTIKIPLKCHHPTKV